MRMIDGLQRTLARSIAGISLVIFVAGCSDDTTDPGDNQITVPTTYTYTSSFDGTKSSVNYSAEVVQNLLIEDLRERIQRVGESGATAVTKNDLLALYNHVDGTNLQTTTETGSLPPLERQYNRIATGQNLKGKVSSAQLINMSQNADQLINELFQTVADNTLDINRLGTPMAYTTDDGLDVSEFVSTLLYGALSYHQATTYLRDLADMDNSANNGVADAPATEMERAWDAVFGYFGASRDYARYSDANLSGPVSDFVFDSNGDGRIDFRSEFNFPAARFAGARDNGRSTNFTKTIFDAFLTGRATIAGDGPFGDIDDQREIVLETWERIIGATLIHYLNTMVTHIDALTEDSTPENSAEMNRDWAIMKGLGLSLQFNPEKMITDQNLQIVHNYLENRPQYFPPGTSEYSAYRSRLNLARTIIQNTYGFSGTDVNAW